MLEWNGCMFEPADAVLPRVDVLISVITLDGETTTRVLHGTPAVLPVPPAYQWPKGFDCLAWIPMCYVRVNPCATSITAHDVEEVR